MPLIREDVVRLPRERRLHLVDDLRKAVTEPAQAGPVIFEIPFAGARYDIMVVWEQWKGVRPDERADIISEAYAQRGVDIAQAMGVTYDEAMQDHLLPYLIQPCAREGEANPSELRDAMLKEGAIAFDEGKVDLRFPTMRMAEAAFERLRKDFPRGYWSLAVEG